MNSEARRTIVAMLVAMGVFFAFHVIVTKLYPPKPAPTTQASQPAAEPLTAGQTPASGATSAPSMAAGSRPTTAAAGSVTVMGGADTAPVFLGGVDGDALKIELDPRGATLSDLWLYAKNKKGQFVHRADAESNEPYHLLAPVDDDRFRSYATTRVWIAEFDNRYWDLDNVAWAVAAQTAGQVIFTATLRDGEQDLLRFTKTYQLLAGKPVFELNLTVENVSDRPLTVRLDQDGPLGIKQEHMQYDMRKLLVTQFQDGTVQFNKGYDERTLRKATKSGEPTALLVPNKGPFVWTALGNKYFSVFTRPLPPAGEEQDFVAAVTGLVVVPEAPKALGDLVARISLARAPLEPGGKRSYPFEVYAGAKDAGTLAEVNPDYTDPAKLHYQLAQAADARACCSFCAFSWLRELMVWLLEKIYFVVRNYGIAVIILVLIIRTLLHPLTVFQQKSMFKMQEAMGRIQPKMNAIKEKYANDRTKQNQEMMKLWGEENINPAQNFVSFIPLFLQMPILIALWTALNTDVNLRHAMFDPWWITDLSAPDAAYTFSGSGLTIPVLAWLPVVGSWFTNIPTLNLLPLLMGVSMWLQQKYMPKPHMQAKLDAAKKAAAEGKKSGPSMEDQMRQQQVMMYMMSVMFPLMFYYWPSGLNLYWMASNVFGICESLIIRRQIDRDKQRRETLGPAPKSKRTGIVSRFFKHIASQAEELQRKADELAKDPGKKKKP